MNAKKIHVGCPWIKHEQTETHYAGAASCQFLVAFQVDNSRPHAVYSMYSGALTINGRSSDFQLPWHLDTFLFIAKTETKKKKKRLQQCFCFLGCERVMLAARTLPTGDASPGLYLFKTNNPVPGIQMAADGFNAQCEFLHQWRSVWQWSATSRPHAIAKKSTAYHMKIVAC